MAKATDHTTLIKPKNSTEPIAKSFDFKIYNGRIKVYINGYVAFSFNQIDFAGYYAFKDCTSLYGITIYLNREKAGAMEMDIYFKTKQNWLSVLELLDNNL
jgi:hypothetical protein